MGPSWRDLALLAALVVGAALVCLLALFGLFILVVDLLLGTRGSVLGDQVGKEGAAPDPPTRPRDRRSGKDRRWMTS